MKKNCLKPIAFATMLALSSSVLAAPISEGTYETINEASGWSSIGDNTVTVTSGQVYAKDGFGVGAQGVLYLNSDDASITSEGATYLYGTIRKDEKTALNNLTVSNGDFTFAGLEEQQKFEFAGDLTYTSTGTGRLYIQNADFDVKGTLTFDSAGSYFMTSGNSAITVDRFVSKGKYGLKNGDNGRGVMEATTFTARQVEAEGMFRNTNNATINILESASIGTLWNLGEFNASDAIVEVTGEYMDGTTAADGNTYIFGNGMDKDLNDGAKDSASMTVGTLIVHGNAMNSASTSLSVKNMKIDGILNNDDSGAVINVNNGVAQAGTIGGKAGQFNLTNASLEATNSSNFGSVVANDSTVVINAPDNTMTSFTGENKTVLVNQSGASLSIGEKTGDMTVAASGSVNDQYASAEETLSNLSSAVTVDQGTTEGDKLVVLQGDVNDGITAILNENGEYVIDSVQKNTTIDGFGSISALGIMQWRHEMNDLSKRMGELRDSPEGVGAWARIYGSEQEYGAQDVTSKNTSVQVGADFDVGSGWKVGAAFTYTDGSSDYHGGDADNKAYSLAAYGTWMAENGQFVDLVAKYSRLSTDFDLNAMDGDYDNNAFSVSAEYGWHLRFNESFFVEPQVEVTYGQVKGETVKTSNGVRLEQDDFDSLIGRVGVRAGFHFPKDKGTIYARVSGLHDFQGDYDVTATKGKAVNDFSDDLGDTWVEFGLGANFNWTDNTYTYVDLERSNGGEIKENWRWNIGLRHVF